MYDIKTGVSPAMTVNCGIESGTQTRGLRSPGANAEGGAALMSGRGAYITRGTWQSDISQIVTGLRKEGQAGWLYFVEDAAPDS